MEVNTIRGNYLWKPRRIGGQYHTGQLSMENKSLWRSIPYGATIYGKQEFPGPGIGYDRMPAGSVR